MHFVRPGLIQVISTNATLLLGSWVWTPIPSQTHWMWIWSGQSGLDWLDGTVTVTMHSFIRIRIRTCLSHACRISHIEFENLIGGCQRCWWWWPWLSVFLCCVCIHNSSCAIGKLSERMRSPTESIPSGNPTLRCCKRLDDDGSRIISADCRGSTWRVDDDEKAWQFAL